MLPARASRTKHERRNDARDLARPTPRRYRRREKSLDLWADGGQPVCGAEPMRDSVRSFLLKRQTNHLSRDGSCLGGHIEGRETAPGVTGRERSPKAFARKIGDHGAQSLAPHPGQATRGPVDVAIEVKGGANNCAHESSMML